MTWYVEAAERLGAVDALTLDHASPAAALGAAVESRVGRLAGTHWCSTRRLTDRVAAAEPGASVKLLPGLGLGYLDIYALLEVDSVAYVPEPELDLALELYRQQADRAVLTLQGGRWDVLLPDQPAPDLQVEGLPSVPAADLAAILDRLQAGPRRKLLLELTIEQFAGADHPLLLEPDVRIDLRVGADVPIRVVAEVVARKPSLGRLRLTLTASMESVAKGSLLSTISTDIDELALDWRTQDDERVSGSIIPQLTLAFRNVPAFARWSQRWQQSLNEPFGVLLTGGTYDGTTVVATDAALVPAALLGPDIALLAPIGSPDLGQRDLRFDHPDLFDATAAMSGSRVLRFAHYAEPIDPSGEGPVLQSLSTTDDVSAFLLDLDGIRTTGHWPDPGRCALEYSPAVQGWDRLPARRLIFIDRRGIRSSRSGPARPMSELGELGSLDSAAESALRSGIAERPYARYQITGLRLRERFGAQVRFGPPPLDSAPLAEWVVGWTPIGAVLAETHGRRRVFKVAPWVASLVEATQQGVDQGKAVLAAVEAGGSNESECRAVLDRLAA